MRVDTVSQAAAYGFRIDGLPPDGALAALGVGVEWPTLHLRQERGDTDGETFGVFEDTATLRVANATAVLDRVAASATFLAGDPVPPGDLVHPCLWPAAGVFARWLGRETLHAGGFLDDDGAAWAVLGDSGDGKSSLLAALGLAGRPVLVDDLLVIDGGDCFAGPRCLDLHPDAATALGVQDATTLVRATSRRRLALPAIAGRVPLRGFVHLQWGDEIGVDAVAPAERLRRLAHHRRVVALGIDPVDLLELSRLPAVQLRRPRSWAAAAPACRRLLAELEAIGGDSRR